MTIGEGFIKSFKKFKSKIVYRIKSMRPESWDFYHTLDSHNITIGKFRSRYFFSFFQPFIIFTGSLWIPLFLAMLSTFAYFLVE